MIDLSSISDVDSMIRTGLYLNDLSLHDFSRDMVRCFNISLNYFRVCLLETFCVFRDSNISKKLLTNSLKLARVFLTTLTNIANSFAFTLKIMRSIASVGICVLVLVSVLVLLLESVFHVL